MSGLNTPSSWPGLTRPSIPSGLPLHGLNARELGSRVKPENDAKNKHPGQMLRGPGSLSRPGLEVRHSTSPGLDPGPRAERVGCLRTIPASSWPGRTRPSIPDPFPLHRLNARELGSRVKPENDAKNKHPGQMLRGPGSLTRPGLGASHPPSPGLDPGPRAERVGCLRTIPASSWPGLTRPSIPSGIPLHGLNARELGSRVKPENDAKNKHPGQMLRGPGSLTRPGLEVRHPTSPGLDPGPRAERAVVEQET